MEHIQWGGWNCARLLCDDLELIVTCDVGPRVISFGFSGGANEFHVKDKDLGQTGGSEYRGYGGHRLWMAPEDRVRTYTPDNEPVNVAETPDGISFSSKADEFGYAREIAIRTDSAKRSITLTHRVHNCGQETRLVAPWALTVMDVGGICLVPQEPYVSHENELLPARPLVLWGYTKMNDPRYTWGERLIQLRQDTSMGPTKFGALVKSGLVGHLNGDRLFIKQFEFDPTATYPDFQCNFESFTRHDMLEVESLGALRSLAPGETATMVERWTLVKHALDLQDEGAVLDALSSHAKITFG